jgi:hypothetical protein
MKRTIAFISVLALLALFPVMALLMSRSGLLAYKELKSEMRLYKDSISISSLEMIQNDTVYVYIKDFERKVLLLHFMQDLSTFKYNELRRVVNEFSKKTKRIQIIELLKQDDSLSVSHNDSSVCFVLKDEELKKLTNLVKVSKDSLHDLVILVDRRGFVTNTYRLTNKSVTNDLMRHITLLLPFKEDRRKIKFERDKDILN